MANSWGIPFDLEQQIIKRDAVCVYCGCKFTNPKTDVKKSPSWEHIVNDASIVTLENIARCCRACNASKGAKELKVWLLSLYCKNNNICRETVANVVKAHLK
jgi:hypothetical protein